MSLRDRLAALERRHIPAEPVLIVIRGGLHTRDPRETIVAGEVLTCGDDEPIRDFHTRCIAAARATGQAHVIIGGLPDG
jgi:hypothetical protein